MTVNITFAPLSGGDSLADTIDLGSTTPGTSTNIQDVFIRHDAIVNPITDCALYLQRYVGSNYLGENEDDDLVEVMSWGDAAIGGCTINQVIPSGWVYGDPFDSGDNQIFKNGYGDIDNQLILDEDSISIGTPAGDGVIPVSGEAHIQFKVQIPSVVPEGAGVRAVTMVFSYSATS